MEETRTIEDVIQDDEIQNLKQRIEDAETTARQGKSIKMGRVPHKTHDEFKDMAEAMFCDDYGMTLTFLHEYYKINEQNKEMFNALEQRISSIEQALATQDENEEDDSTKVETLNG